MGKKVDRDHLTITGAHDRIEERHVSIHPEPEGVVIVVSQAYGPRGDNLVGISNVEFDGHPAVTIGVRTPDGREGLVHLSPIHGDPRKIGMTDIEPGTPVQLFCPVSREPLPYLGEVEDGSGARYYGIYLTPRLSDGAVVAVSDVWDHYHSRIVDGMELISYWAATHEPS